MMKQFKLGLLPKIILALILGASVGSFLPGSVVRGVNTFTALFDQFIKFMVPVIIVGLVTPAIAETGKGAGKMLVITVLLAYASTLFAGFFSYFASVSIFPALVDPNAVTKVIGKTFEPYFKIAIPPLMDVMSALIFAFMMGLGIVVAHADILRRAALESREIVTRTISVALIPLLPFYIFGIFADMAASGKVAPILAGFAKVVIVIFLISVTLLLIQFTVAGIVGRCNPFKMLLGMMPAYFTALGTSSSAATIPVTLRRTIANGVREDIAQFCIPLCATVHLAGSTLKITACSIALMLMSGEVPTFTQFAGFIAMLGVVMVAAPGVPGGAIMAALGIISSFLGFSQERLGVMITLYIAMDSFGTACNVTGDGAIALILNRFAREQERSCA